MISTNKISKCDAPEELLTPHLIEQLQQRKAALLSLLSQTQPVEEYIPIQPVSRREALPLSFAQQRLWVLEQLGSEAAYNMPVPLTFRGSLNVTALEQMLTEIVRRHESLRTTFKKVDSEVRQVFLPLTTVHLPLINLQHLPIEEQMAEVQRLASQETLRPFDLANDLMVRTTLLRLNNPAPNANGRL